jgi:hypothetical protein
LVLDFVIDGSLKLVHCRKSRALGRVARSQDVSVRLLPRLVVLEEDADIVHQLVDIDFL